MLRKIFFLGVVFSVCCSSTVFAAGINGAKTSGKGKFSIGADQEFLFDRNMNTGMYDNGDTEFKADFEVSRTMLKAAFGILDNVDIYAKVGVADFKGDSNVKYFDDAWVGGVDIGKWKQNGETAPAYGVGMKWAQALTSGILIGADVQYLQHKNDFKGTESWDAYDGSGVWQYAMAQSLNGNMLFQEWQAALYVAKEMGAFVPYAGVKYSDLRTQIKMEFEGYPSQYKYNSQADKHVGVFVGSNYELNKTWALGLEGRFVDETAMSLSVVAKF